MNDFSKRLGQRIKSIRGDASLREFAPQLGLAAKALHRIEGGEQNITLETLAIICKHLNCKAGDLIDEGGKFAPREQAPQRKRRPLA